MVTRNDFAVIAIQNVWGEGVGVGGGSEEKGEVCKTGDGKFVCMCACALVCLYGWVCVYVVKVSTYM